MPMLDSFGLMGISVARDGASRLARYSGAIALSAALLGCDCQCPEAKAPTKETVNPEPVAVAPVVEKEEPVAAPAATSPPAEEPAPAEAKPAPVEPKFTPGMSVDEAIAAVPRGSEFLGIDREALGRPLSDPELYKPCKLTAAQHFNLRVAVWDGKAVGIDVSSKNKALSECIYRQVQQVEWSDKVKAINTVDFAY